MSSKESSSKAGAAGGTSTFNNAARKTSLFGNMKRKQSNTRAMIERSIKNDKNKHQRTKSESSFDSDFNSEKG